MGNSGSISGQFQQLDQVLQRSVGVGGGDVIVGGVKFLATGEASQALKPWETNAKYLWGVATDTNQQFNDLAFPPSAQEIQRRQTAAATQARNVFNQNAQAQALAVGHVANSAYSGNMSSVVPPSQLQKISDPATKMARAGATGGRLHLLNAVGMASDISAHPTLAQATGASADVNPMPSNQNTGTASQVPNGAETLSP